MAAPGEIKIWDVHELKEIQSIPAHRNWICGVSFRKDGKRMVTGGGDQRVIVWDFETRKPVFTFLAKHVVRDVAFSPNGRWVAAGCSGGILQLWDTRER